MKAFQENPREFLSKIGLAFRETNDELIIKCPFNDCDSDSRPNESHLYISSETGQYHCKKCGAKGNLITLARYLGATLDLTGKDTQQTPPLTSSTINRYHKALPDRIRQYLNERGISDRIIGEYKLGWGKFYGQNWITIPIPNNQKADGYFLKLRRDPQNEDKGEKYMTYPSGNVATLYGWEMLSNNEDMVVICEGELDRLVLVESGIPAVTSTAGATTFKEEWVKHFAKLRNIYVCFDRDEQGQKGVSTVVEKLSSLSKPAIFKIDLPDRMTEGKDITDYFTKYNGNPDELMLELPELVHGKVHIDTSKFKSLGPDSLAKILELTIKEDKVNKIATFLCELLAYTSDSQFNISFNAPSSTGKSYIPMEIARLFPSEDVVEIGYSSPTAFFHEAGEFQKEHKRYIVDLSRKILIFLDQPHTQLLERLRAFLSHDKKEITSKITDKNQRFGLRTKTVVLKGYPAVIFCTAGLRIDEQEATRFLLLSPETSKVKLENAIHERLRKESDSNAYTKELKASPERKQLMERIRAIKQENIDDIKVPEVEELEKWFRKKHSRLMPRHTRDVGRLISLVKGFALLNLWLRKREDNSLIACREDIKHAISIWEELSRSQELNLPPYIYNLYWEVVYQTWKSMNPTAGKDTDDNSTTFGVTRQNIIDKHYEVYGRHLSDDRLRKQILPMLDNSGLVRQEQDETDKRRKLIFPLLFQKPGNNGGAEGGVTNNNE